MVVFLSLMKGEIPRFSGVDIANSRKYLPAGRQGS
jgi:hypothetical protein